MERKTRTHPYSKRSYFWPVVILCLLLPLAFINIKDSHDWGDDFAMYLKEAKNLAEHKPAGESGFIINKDAMMGPQSYPIGFPLILSPVVKHYGIDFKILNVYQSVLLICCLLFGFLFLSRHFSEISSLLMTLVIAYNPLTVNFKTEILSDIPFWMILNCVLCIVYYNKNTTGWMIVAGLLTGFSIHVRSIGLVLLISLLAFWILNYFKNKNSLLSFKNYLAFAFGFLVVYLGLNILYPLNTSYQYFEGEILNTSANHLSYNLESISNFFKSPGLSDYYFVTSVCAYTFLVFMLLGFVLELRVDVFAFVNILTVLFFGVVILYHFGDAGIRLILPLMFIFFYYFAKGIKQTLLALQFNYKAFTYALTAILFFVYIEPVKKLIQSSGEVIEGPCTQASKELFDFMRVNNIVNKTIGFDRPRALALFTNNKSVHLSDEHLAEETGLFGLDYILVHQFETSEPKKNIVRGDTVKYQPVFSNSMYELYKVAH